MPDMIGLCRPVRKIKSKADTYGTENGVLGVVHAGGGPEASLAS